MNQNGRYRKTTDCTLTSVRNCLVHQNENAPTNACLDLFVIPLLSTSTPVSDRFASDIESALRALSIVEDGRRKQKERERKARPHLVYSLPPPQPSLVVHKGGALCGNTRRPSLSNEGNG